VEFCFFFSLEESMKKEQEAVISVCLQPGFDELFGAYVTGQATAAQEEVMEHHLADCAQCRKSVAMFFALDEEMAHKVFPDI
jgi:Putative zinc-finger